MTATSSPHITFARNVMAAPRRQKVLPKEHFPTSFEIASCGLENEELKRSYEMMNMTNLIFESFAPRMWCQYVDMTWSEQGSRRSQDFFVPRGKMPQSLINNMWPETQYLDIARAVQARLEVSSAWDIKIVIQDHWSDYSERQRSRHQRPRDAQVRVVCQATLRYEHGRLRQSMPRQSHCTRMVRGVPQVRNKICPRIEENEVCKILKPFPTSEGAFKVLLDKSEAVARAGLLGWVSRTKTAWRLDQAARRMEDLE